MTFVLDTRIENDSVFVCDWPLSHVRLSKNSAFPWIILIPREEGITEIIDLNENDQMQLLKEMRAASTIMRDHFKPTKLNVANLGNIVAQLHVHIVARFDTDKAWPGPIWNSGVNVPHSDASLQKTIDALIPLFESAF